MLASGKGHAHIVRALLSQDPAPNVDLRDHMGRTALYAIGAILFFFFFQTGIHHCMCLYLATLVRFAACMPAGRATQSASKHCFCMIRHPTRTRRTRARSRHCSRQPPAGMACARFCFSHSRQKYSQETRCACVACGWIPSPVHLAHIAVRSLNFE